MLWVRAGRASLPPRHLRSSGTTMQSGGGSAERRGRGKQSGGGSAERRGRGKQSASRRASAATSREGGRRGERGSISVELVVVAPGLALLLLLIAAGARVVEVQGHIDGAARDAARAASVARSYAQAVEAAQQAAQADLGPASLCAPRTVGIQVAGYRAVPLTGGGVTVTVTCAVNMSPFTALGFGLTKRFTGQAVAPLDPFMCRDVAC
jgi:Flp pilus assembly protein TadG